MNKKAISNVLASTFLLLVLGVGVYSVAAVSIDQSRQAANPTMCLHTVQAAPGFGNGHSQGICTDVGAGAVHCPGTSGTCTPGQTTCCTLAGGSYYHSCGVDGTWSGVHSCLASQICSTEGVGGYCTPASPPQ